MAHAGMVATAFVGSSNKKPREAEVERAMSERDQEDSERAVRDVMTSPVVTVPAHATIREISEALLRNGVSAVPVVDAHGHLLGIVSEVDLLVKELAMGRGAQLAWLAGKREDIQRRREARNAMELMSTPVITIHPDAPVRQAAKTMFVKRIKRLPVVSGGWLVGIVSRSDLLNVYLEPDQKLLRRAERMLAKTFGCRAAKLQVVVRDGILTVDGEAATRTEADLVAQLLCQLEGAVRVRSHLTFRCDDVWNAEVRRAAHLRSQSKSQLRDSRQ
jgi:CBS domain-containing protein